MFTFNNSSISGSYSMRPKKDKNPVEYINIQNETFNENNNFLNIDLKSINFENMAVELALNVLQLKHNKYSDMNQQNIIEYYNDKIKLNNNINSILALKIILKHKLKDVNVPTNKINKTNTNEFNTGNNNVNNTTNNKKFLEQQNTNNFTGQNQFTIVQNGKKTNQNDFKITQIDNKNKNSNILIKNNYQTNIPDNNIKYFNMYQQNNPNLYQQNNPNIKYNQNNPYLKHNNSQPNNHIQIANSSEFDIDSIINSYTQKKTNGMIK